MYNKQTYRIMGFMTNKITANKTDLSRANSIANSIVGVVVAIFVLALIFVVTYYA